MLRDVPTLEEVLPWLVLLVAVTGCSQLRTVTVPKDDPTINLVTDSNRIAEYPPVEPEGQRTEPAERTLIDDTAQTPALQVQRVEVDNRPDEGQVRFYWEEGERTIRDDYPLPVYGEMLVWAFDEVDRRGYPLRSIPTNRPRDTPDTAAPDTVRDSVFVPPVRPMAEIIGSPQERQVKAKVTSEPPWYTRLWTKARLVLAFVAGAFVTYVVVKLIPGL